ncbi:MAG: OmpA family protein [Gammaproteobacteria bacterium]|nr:OmpA family protein [Gammaproteobacteria bacterium]
MTKKWITSFVCAGLLVALFAGLSGCAHDAVPAYVKDPVLQNLTAHERRLIVDIDSSGIQVIKQGMRFTFVIPTDGFFENDTRELNPARDKDLDRLAEFIVRYTRYFAHPKVSVTGYTDKVWLNPTRRKLSRHYADAITTVLQDDGVSSIVSVGGEGAKHPIASNHYPMGTAFNRRVEVTIH